MLKEYSRKAKIDVRIEHFVKVSQHFGTTVPVFDNYLTEFKSLEEDEDGFKWSGQFKKGTNVVEGIAITDSDGWSNQLSYVQGLSVNYSPDIFVNIHSIFVYKQDDLIFLAWVLPDQVDICEGELKDAKFLGLFGKI